jgi:hypothetical protein
VVPQVLAQGLDALPRVQEHGGVEVPEGMHAVLMSERYAGRSESRTPHGPVETEAVQPLTPSVDEQQRGRDGRAVRALLRRVTSTGSCFVMCAASAKKTVSGSGT